MRFFPKSALTDRILPMVEETYGDKYTSRNINKEQKHGHGIPVQPPSKPSPARTHSTRIQEPSRDSSHRNKSLDEQTLTATSSVASRKNKKTPQRPGLERRRTTARTRYIDMLLGLDQVSPLHNILASLSVYILLAGYIVFPGTFTKLQSQQVNGKVDERLQDAALNTVRNVSLLYIAAFACGIGILGCLWLWWKHRKNYVWVINRIFMPALLNSLAGLVSTIVNIYSAQDGQYSVTAKVTIVVTASCSAVAAALFLLYNMVMLKMVKKRHEREIRAAELNEDERFDKAHQTATDGSRMV